MKRLIASLLALLPTFGAAKVLTGNAGFYHVSYIGKPMANGEPYNPEHFTVACDHLPLGTRVRIKYTSRAGHVRVANAVVTDRGPAKHLQREKDRQFDFSWTLFRHFESPRVGVIRVEVEVIK